MATTPTRDATARELVFNRLPLLRANRGISRNGPRRGARHPLPDGGLHRARRVRAEPPPRPPHRPILRPAGRSGLRHRTVRPARGRRAHQSTGARAGAQEPRMLEIIDLAKRYGPVVALDGATFAARPGRIVGFLGPNGAGKTTTMRCMFGLARPRPRRGPLEGPAGRSRHAPAVRLHARAARPLPADAGRRAAQLLRPAARHVGQGGQRGRDPLARADGSRRPRRSPSSRSCRTATSSASSWPPPSSTTRSCSSSTSRSRGSTRSASRP